jgi:beta-lactamase superfamily II metal-dependent hydrolase
MYEVIALPVGSAAKSGDAMLLRFKLPNEVNEHRVIIDGGFQEDGDRLVSTFVDYFGTADVDTVILTHPDGDHIGGLGTVVRNLNVSTLALHRPALHGGTALRASGAVEELVEVAQNHGVANIVEPFAGSGGFGGALYVAGPSEVYYETLLAEQLANQGTRARTALQQAAASSRVVQRAATAILPYVPPEVPFGDAGGDSPRNNSATVLDLRIGQERILFTSDAGVPALGRALDMLEAAGRADVPLAYLQIPHHGSRHNLNSETLNRLLGAPTNEKRGWAFVSISAAALEDPRYPSPRVANGCLRRGYPVARTGGVSLQIRSEDLPYRPGFGPATPLPPLDETIDARP